MLVAFFDIETERMVHYVFLTLKCLGKGNFYWNMVIWKIFCFLWCRWQGTKSKRWCFRLKLVVLDRKSLLLSSILLQRKVCLPLPSPDLLHSLESLENILPSYAVFLRDLQILDQGQLWKQITVPIPYWEADFAIGNRMFHDLEQLNVIKGGQLFELLELSSEYKLNFVSWFLGHM